jgi:hypothetical protein
MSFCHTMADGPPWVQKPETVGFSFNNREFVWHAPDGTIPDLIFGDREIGPTIVTVLREPGELAAAETEVERLLSALSFVYMQPAQAIAHGTSHGSDPWGQPLTRAPRTNAGWMMGEGHGQFAVANDSNLRTALAYHREGHNAGSPFYRFLAFWNSIDVVFNSSGRDRRDRDTFLDVTVPRFQQRWDDPDNGLPQHPAKHFRHESRHAIAHAVRDPGQTEIDPDLFNDRQRLEHESRFLGWIARAAIETRYAHPVATAERVSVR